MEHGPSHPPESLSLRRQLNRRGGRSSVRVSLEALEYVRNTQSKIDFLTRALALNSSIPPSSGPPSSNPLQPPQAAAPPFATMSLYSANMDGAMQASQGPPPAPQEPQVPKASQACSTCRKQKRKCTKTLPSCDLCVRMSRHCDYSAEPIAPTADQFNDLQRKFVDLEAKFMALAPNAFHQHPNYPTPSSMPMQSPDHNGIHVYPRHELNFEIRNKFPSIAFLDADAFKHGRISLPKPVVEVTQDVVDILGDSTSLQAMIVEYFSTIHIWMPIISKKRLDRNLANPLWEAGPEQALLFLCMKLITSKPQDGIDSSQNPIYLSAKRFIVVMEASGMISLLVLQANLLVTWYEYGQAIYPAAWMSAGWCGRYGNLLGINGNADAIPLLGNPGTWGESEERRRVWWAVLLTDRIISLGSMAHIPNSQDPSDDAFLPINDAAWDAGEMAAVINSRVDAPIEEPVDAFARLCQASMMIGRVFAHHSQEKNAPETDRFQNATRLYQDISNLARKLGEEASNSPDYLSLATPLALTFSGLCKLCDPYSCPPGGEAKTKEAIDMQKQAIEGIETVANSIVDFVDKVNDAAPSLHDLDRISPIIMDALYSGAANFAWLVRESGGEQYQVALERLRNSLRRMGTRWRNAADYAMILEAQEFTYAVGAASG